ncbi:UDP-glucose/GDP-mannose dehydrogenase family protein [Candidatus Daviesbacteria bacterium]|nr:UDP-glucose/GDP-mannose dehydrogenase family protein [Candidatus Daviesbacteria bacterium]
MTISIIGTGYVGLVTGAVFADFGHKVYCVDIDEEKIKMLKNGMIPFYEPGLEELVKRNINQHRLFFTTKYSQAVPLSKIVFICVGTPPAANGEADLTYLFNSVSETAKHLKGYTLIAIKSTVPIGVEDELQSLIGKNTKARYEFASCPEFLREGSAVEDAMKPDRIVFGTKGNKAADILLDLYKHFNGQRLVCDLRSAQMIKYAANALLATKVSFANAVAILCEKTGADVEVVLDGVGLDRRIGRNFLHPGVGYGGSCFPKDVIAFIKIADKAGYDFDLLKSVDQINRDQVDYFVQKTQKLLDGLNDKTIAVLGLSFKPNTDDMREAPSVSIINKLIAGGAYVKAYDPVANDNAKRILQNVDVYFAQDPYDAARGADAIMIVTEWNEFKELDLSELKKLMNKPVIIDGRNIYDPNQVRSLGFIYQGIGRN